MRKIIVIIGFITVALGVNAQKGFDYGLFLGMNETHLSSILPIPDSKGMSFGAGGYYRYSWNERYSWRVGVNAGLNKVVDGYGLVEFNFHPLNSKRIKKVFTSYIATGLSYLVDFSQYTAVQNDQNASMTKYMVRNIRIPFNVGVKYNISSRMTLGMEWALRKGYEMDYSQLPYRYTPLMANWRSNFSVSIGYLVSNYCKTCPFYENERKKLK